MSKKLGLNCVHEKNKMRRICYSWGLFVMLTSAVFGQDSERNIVPNPGFELYSGTPLGWLVHSSVTSTKSYIEYYMG